MLDVVLARRPVLFTVPVVVILEMSRHEIYAVQPAEHDRHAFH